MGHPPQPIAFSNVFPQFHCSFLSYRYRQTVIRNIPQLQKLDNVAVTPEEVADAMRRGLVLDHPLDGGSDNQSAMLQGQQQQHNDHRQEQMEMQQRQEQMERQQRQEQQEHEQNMRRVSQHYEQEEYTHPQDRRESIQVRVSIIKECS